MLEDLALFFCGMLAMLLFKEPFVYIKEMLNSDRRLLETKSELKIRELQLMKIEERIAKHLDTNELEQLKLELWDRYGVDWYKTDRYLRFKEAVSQ